MPNVTASPRQMRNGQMVTQFIDSVGTTSTTFTYATAQEMLVVRNMGVANISVTVGGTTQAVAPGGSQRVEADFTSFSIVSASGVQAFEAWADEAGSTFDSPEGQYFAGNTSTSSSAVARTKLLVATKGAHGAQGGDGASNGTTDLIATGRVRHYIPSPCADLQALYTNVRSRGDTFGNNPIKVKLVFEKADGSLYPAFFDGQALVTIDPGGSRETDPSGLTITQAEIDAGQNYIYSRTYVEVTAGQKYPVCTYTKDNIGEGKVASDVTGVAWNPADNGFQWVYSPLAVFGTALSPKPALALIGDSIMFGSGDDGIGFGSWALGNSFPYTKFAMAGEAFVDFLGQGHVTRGRALQYVTHAICNFIVNDINIHGQTAAQIQANMTRFCDAMAARGIKPYLTTANPSTNSTDGYTTVANQSYSNANYAPGGKVAQVIAWLKATPPASCAGVIDTMALLESSPGSMKWAVDQVLTGDGLHPNTAGSQRMGSFSTAIFTL